MQSDEDGFIRYTSEGAKKAVSFIDFEMQKMWDNVLTRNILIELFNRTLTLNELNDIIRDKMMRYYEEKYKHNPYEKETEYFLLYNPYNSLQSLKKGLLMLSGKKMVEIPTRDGSYDNTYYCLTKEAGLPFIIDQFTDFYIDDPFIFNILAKQQEKVHVTFIAMKWMEIHMPEVNQLLFFFAEKVPPKDFISVYKKYLIQIEGESRESLALPETANRLNDEILEKINSLVSGGYVKIDVKGDMEITKEGMDIIQKVQNSIVNYLTELVSYHLIDQSGDRLYISLTKVGMVIHDNIVAKLKKDIKRLADKPKIIDDPDYHEEDSVIPPIDIFVKQKIDNENTQRQFSIYVETAKDYFLSERIKRVIVSPFVFATLLVMGIACIIGGYITILSGSEIGITLLITGCALIVGFMFLMSLKIKWGRPKYISEKVINKRRKEITKNTKKLF